MDAGAHLASIVRILEQNMPMNSKDMPPPGYSKLLEHGPFAGVRFPNISAKANALYVFRELLHSFLITHPHLDHLSAMSINTPALEYGREAKAIVALSHTIDAIQSHIFNDCIWPNLSDEDQGVGFVTYRRLVDGGNPRLGHGESRGYVSVCDNLTTKCWSVTHGKCRRRHSRSTSHQREGFGDGYTYPSRRVSRVSDDPSYLAALAAQQQTINSGIYGQAPVTPNAAPTPVLSAIEYDHLYEPFISSAFFIRNDITGHEILVFGDIEPDSLSLSPRNYVVWEDAAPKVAAGRLRAIFIECSFDDSCRDEDLYGHLCPRHIVAELAYLAKRVMAAQELQARQEAGTPISASYKMSIDFTPFGSFHQTTDGKGRKRKVAPDGTVSPSPEPDFVNPGGQPQGGQSQPGEQAGALMGSPSRSMSRRKTSHAVSIATSITSPQPRTHANFDSIVPEASNISTPDQFWVRPAGKTTVRVPRLYSPTAASAPGGASGAGVSAIPSSAEYAAAQQSLPTLSHSQHVRAGDEEQDEWTKLPEPLKGVTIHIIHVKDTMADGPNAGDIIGAELRRYAEETGLGCEFDITSCGESIWV